MSFNLIFNALVFQLRRTPAAVQHEAADGRTADTKEARMNSANTPQVAASFAAALLATALLVAASVGPTFLLA